MSDFHDNYVHIRGGLYSSATPVYHRSRMWDAKKVDGDIFTIPAACGLPLLQWNRETGARYHNATVFWRGHAEKFGRPCRRCFPEAQ